MTHSNPAYKPGDLLTKMEVCELFCQELRISENTYYKHYRPFIKFHPYGRTERHLQRIPYRVAMGLINEIKETPAPADPPREVLMKFRKTNKKAT